jgi:putative phosphoribosyl transferase
MVEQNKLQIFTDRRDAGTRLASKLKGYAGSKDCVLLAIPKGGIPVAVEISLRLNTPMDLIIVRKIPVPWSPEAGFGAVTDDGAVVLNQSMLEGIEIGESEIEQSIEKVKREIERRRFLFRGEEPPVDLKGKTAILVDDGLASGYTMIAAIKSVEKREAEEIIVAVPVASQSAADRVRPECDDLVALVISHTISFAVASYYRDWHDLSDDEALKLLSDYRHARK